MKGSRESHRRHPIKSRAEMIEERRTGKFNVAQHRQDRKSASARCARCKQVRKIWVQDDLWKVYSQNRPGEGKVCWICLIRELVPDWRPGRPFPNLFLATEHSAYEGTVILEIDKVRTCLIGFHRGARAEYLDGTPFDLNEIALKRISMKALRDLQVELLRAHLKGDAQ